MDTKNNYVLIVRPKVKGLELHGYGVSALQFENRASAVKYVNHVDPDRDKAYYEFIPIVGRVLDHTWK